MKVTKVKNLDEKVSRINSKQFKKWIVALRSGKFSQTTGQLQGSEGFCCLGVACKVLIPKKKQVLKKGYSFVGLKGEYPAEQKSSPKWLASIDYDFKQRQDISPYYSEEPRYHLAELNDERKMKFDEIADILELVYVHGMLEEK